MKRLRTIAAAVFLGGGLIASLALPFLASAAFTVPGAPTGFVNDFAGVLSAEEKTALESRLAAFNSSTTIEIAIAIVSSLGGDTIETAARQIFDSWKIGKEKEDNGVLILLAMEDREIRIEPGYGLEGALTDIQSKHIIEDVMIPLFQQGNYYEGLAAGADSVIAAVQGEDFAGAPSGVSAGQIEDFISSLGWFFPIILFAFLRGFAILLGKTKSWWLGGVLGSAFGVAIGFFVASLLAGILATIFIGLFGLIFDYGVSRSYDKWKSGGGRGPWLGGGGFGGGRGGGGGFGGFGGGMSGGGGASGRF